MRVDHIQLSLVDNWVVYMREEGVVLRDMSWVKKALVIGLTVLGVGGMVLGQGCATCDEEVLKEWFQEPPFEFWQAKFNPYTVGLPAGAPAPTIPGVDFAESNTVVWVVNRDYNPEYLPLVRGWGETPGLQVVTVAAQIFGLGVGELRTGLGEGVKLILEPQARVVAAQYLVGEYSSPVTFLVDRSGTIVWRRRGAFRLSEGPEYDRIVRYFADHGSLPDDALAQHVLWYGDSVPWPDFPLYTFSGEKYWLGPGKPVLIMQVSPWGPNSVVHRELDAVRAQFPEVEFIWLFAELTEDASVATWEYARRIGLDRVYPEIFDVPLEEYMVREAVEKAEEKAQLAQYFTEHPMEWTGGV